MSSYLSPQESVVYLNAWLAGVVPEVTSHGGIIDKLLGDTVLVFFEKPHQAMEAALGMFKHVQVACRGGALLWPDCAGGVAGGRRRREVGAGTDPITERTPPATGKERAMRTRNPWGGGAQGVDGRYNARRSGAPGPRAHGNAVTQVVDDRRAEVRGAGETVKRPPQQPAQPRHAN